MFSSIPLRPISLQKYSEFLDSEEFSEIERLAHRLRDARVLHLNTTGFGTRVADMIGVMGGLMRGQGIDSRWQVLRVTSQLIDVYRRMYEAMQSTSVPWDPETASLWLEYNSLNASQFEGEYDYVIVHDPQAVPLLTEITRRNGERPHGVWLWHDHFDLREANPEVRRFLAAYIGAYDAVLAEMESYLYGDDLPNPRVIIPAIDPLNPRNAIVPPDAIPTLLFAHGIDADRPIVSQISHLEPAVDPLGAIEVWRLAKQSVPELQMILAFPTIFRGSASHGLFHRVVNDIQADTGIYILSPLDGLGNLEVNLLRQASAVILQKSIGRGFGLVVAEAMWKGKPVIASNKGGIPLQIVDGETGYLCDAVESCADRLVYLVQNETVAREMGARARERVRKNFLITRYLKDYLNVLLSFARK